MALYALGDLHLAFQRPDKSMDAMGPVWVHHEEKIWKNCQKLVKPEDTLVLLGDHSWGRKLPQCQKDLEFIAALPGRKILLRGNHDMFWEAQKTEALNERYAGKLFFLQNNFAAYGDYALVGTKGFTFEGPFLINRFTGEVLSWDEEAEKHAQKLVKREAQRLEESFEKAKAAGYKKFIMFLHYPPTNILEEDSIFTRMAEQYGAEQVVYAHCHGENTFDDSYKGEHNGVFYRLVSGDYVDFVPQKILD